MKNRFQLIIDLFKSSRPHKYLRKYRKGDKWVYIYYEAENRPRHLEDEAIKIIQRMAELGDERARSMLEQTRDVSDEIEELKAKIRETMRADERNTIAPLVRTGLKARLLQEYGIDKEGEELEGQLIPAQVLKEKEASRDTVDKTMSVDVKEKLERAVVESVRKMYDHLAGHQSSDFYINLVRDFVTSDELKEGVFEKRSLKEAMAKFNENLKKVDEAHRGLRSSNNWASNAGGYGNAIYNDAIGKLVREGVLPRGYENEHERTRQEDGSNNAPAMPTAREMEVAAQKRAEREARERAEREERERRERAEAEERLRVEHAELVEKHGESLTDFMEHYRITDAQITAQQKVNFMKGIDKFWGKDFKFKRFIENFQGHPDVEIKINRDFFTAFMNQPNASSLSLTATFIEKSTGRQITSASRSVSKTENGGIHWHNGCFSRPNSEDLKRYRGMATGLYAGVEKNLREITANYSDRAKQETIITIGTAANSGFSNSGYKGALVWAKHCFDWAGGSRASSWRQMWKSQVQSYKRNLNRNSEFLNPEVISGIDSRIDSCEYPEDFVRLGVRVTKEQAKKLLNRTGFDSDFNEKFEEKGYVDLGELIIIDVGVGWSAENRIWGTDTRSVELNRRRAIQYRWVTEQRADNSKDIEIRRLPQSSPSQPQPQQSSSSTASGSSPPSDSSTATVTPYRAGNNLVIRTTVGDMPPLGRDYVVGQNYEEWFADVSTLKTMNNGMKMINRLPRGVRSRMSTETMTFLKRVPTNYHARDAISSINYWTNRNGAITISQKRLNTIKRWNNDRIKVFLLHAKISAGAKAKIVDILNTKIESDSARVAELKRLSRERESILANQD